MARNAILAALPKDEYERIFPHLEIVQLTRGRIVYNVGDTVRHAYFVLTGMLSLLSVTADGRTVEVAIIGSEGIAGIFTVLTVSTSPYQIVVQSSGDAIRLRANLLKEAFQRGGRFQELLLRYTHSLLTQVSQSAACNHFHTIEQRLCRRLLVSCDRVKSDTFYITQEFISHMLGAPRSGVTAAAGTLKERGLIRYSRGRITILDRRGLESTTCECYQMLSEEIAKLVATSRSG
ncbi:MAG TPA: Crp/Fnr family transcriptional regulator [Pyrinomonadaceae bacterium]|nr:Crp/Fnr family transcriptional regulator [Pyrinomonadaceae bacterium]